MRVIICYDPPTINIGVDIFNRVELIRETLLMLGHMVINSPYKLSPEHMTKEFSRYNPDVIWNLFETFNGRADEHYFGAIFLDESGYKYTGSSAQAVLFCSDKVILKQILKGAGANTPIAYARDEKFIEGKWIIKPKTLDLTTNQTGGTVLQVFNEQQLKQELLKQPLTKHVYAEQYIEGTEYAIYLLDRGEGLKAMNIAKVGYNSFAYNAPNSAIISKEVLSSVEFVKHSDATIEKLKTTAEIIGKILNLKSYATINLKIALDGKIWAMDATCNPLIDNNSDFILACQDAGIDLVWTVKYILESAIKSQ